MFGNNTDKKQGGFKMDKETLIDLKLEEEHKSDVEQQEPNESAIFRRGEEFAFTEAERETIFPSARKIYRRSRTTGGRSSLGIF